MVSDRLKIQIMTKKYYISVLNNSPSLDEFKDNFPKLIYDKEISVEDKKELSILYYKYWLNTFRPVKGKKKKK